MDRFNIRKAAVAGQFYPASAESIRRQIEEWRILPGKKSPVIGCMLPHAGYMYSGKVAAQTLAHIDLDQVKTVVLMGPNHTGYGVPFSIMAEGIWATPLGQVEINNALAQEILKGSKYLETDSMAHAYEHSLEVELPLLQFFKNAFQIVPIVFGSDDLKALQSTGQAIAAAIERLKLQGTVLLAASSDMTHYEPAQQAKRKDQLALQQIMQLDEQGLLEKVRSFDISMCGYAPVISMLAAAKALGAHKAQVVTYSTSGDVTGDDSSVVGYAGVLIH
jgi:hypothetical protein